MSSSDKPFVGISSCLLGQNVRHNGGNTKDSWIVSELSSFVDFYPICPEVEMGLGTPREEIVLTLDEKSGERGLKTKTTQVDLTEKANTAYSKIFADIHDRELDGFILMKKSPSCALSRCKAVNIVEKGPGNYIEGLFAYNLKKEFPELPKLDSGRLFNKKMRENFVKQVFTHHRFSKLSHSVSDLQDFHKHYKYILMEHSPHNLSMLGKIAANSDKKDMHIVMKHYKKLMIETLCIETDLNKRFNVLLHLFGYVKDYLNSAEKKRVLSIFEDFRDGISQYMIPVEILNLLVHTYSVDYLADHYYFNPYPKKLNIGGDI
jgi:uncharacterized protein YbgA (DUF1722 family)/uncharacterized protein YbbK (DUF523 family)